MFAAFIIFTLLSIIEWSLRWYGLASLLFIWTVFAIVTLLNGEKTVKEYKQARVIRKAILSFLLVTIVTIPAIVFPQYKPLKTTGEYKVGTAFYTYTDESRLENYTNTGEKRQVTVEFWYPQNTKGVYPIVLFTHGLYGIAMSNASTYEELASNGYVVGSVSHPYISMYTKSTNSKTTIVSNEYINEASIINSGADENLIYDTFKKLQETRIADINFLLDTVLAKIDDGNDPMYRLIDPSKIGLFGHSIGGVTMSVVGRVRENIRAVVNLDAPLFGELLGLQNGEAILIDDIYPKPLLNIYSDNLWGLMDSDPIYAANTKFLLNTPDNIYNTHINGAKHLSLTDLSLFSPVIANILQGGKAEINPTYCLKIMNRIILNFLITILKMPGISIFQQCIIE
jgi:dienelactone hydrolase